MNELRKDLRAICADGAAWSVMVGVGETYLPAFVLALMASQLASGLVATMSMPLLQAQPAGCASHSDFSAVGAS